MTPVEDRLYRLPEMLRSRYDSQYATTFASFVAAGEPVVGLEILSDQLLDDEVGIAPAVFQEIEELSRLMGLKQRYWEQLRGRVQDPPRGDARSIRRLGPEYVVAASEVFLMNVVDI
jgi:hypothetical protein